MKNIQVYVYPDRSYSLRPDTNPYVSNLAKALEVNQVAVIRSKTAWLGVIDIFLHTRRIDAVVFNWVEEVANRTMGYTQALALVFLLPFLKIMGVKIIWTIHNKVSHSSRNRWLSSYFRKVLNRQADLMIAHSKETTQLQRSSRLIYYPHPFKVSSYKPHFGSNFVYDILFWGTILPYKGIKEFLEYVHDKGHTNLRILIQGKCSDPVYYQDLQALETNSIRVINRFTSDDELQRLFELSRTVVFTYRQESVLSSGALIESLVNYKLVIGPNFGNFKDFAQEGLAYTYQDFEELIELVNKTIDSPHSVVDIGRINRFIQDHSWESYALFLKTHILSQYEPQLAEVNY
ncbi:hypothetical protein HNV11_03490 [Spirosoma taeanense]|uniref:Glycosyltransferase n=1 Tax=Spirosoma taeanense TaxID=2735870 RepID=A0A6M5Y5K3_9BACT|nr:hypothetical protein [Spirosoma taeanense]QJW88501.1 hypothetical protein HNV11_03490 [Spirosoma taeanense]